MAMSKALLGLLLLAVACIYGVFADNTITIDTPLGSVRGLISATAQTFRGIPYAQPPVGSLRWKPTVPISPWGANTLDATEFGAGCPQQCELPPNTCPAVVSEDCLTLNVFAPSYATASSSLPVYVFFPGGRFEQGGSGVSLYDSTYFANMTDIVVVTANYRIGALGYAYFESFGGGNFGLMDQKAVLEWVKVNIDSFGGDKTRVTIGGQSAGATSAATMLTLPQFAGLFDAVIMESMPWTLLCKDKTEAIAFGSLLASDAGCDVSDTACLLALSPEAIVTAQKKAQNKFSIGHPLKMFLPFGPVVDGVYVFEQPFTAFQNGKIVNKVPVLTGSVRDEAQIFIWQVSAKPVSEIEYIAALTDIFHLDAAAVYLQYPANTPELKADTKPLLATLGTDFIFWCAARSVAAGLSKVSTPVYLYNFQHLMSFSQGAWGANYSYCYDSICHGEELPFVFHSASMPPTYFTYTPEEQTLSDAMTQYWASFVRNAKPAGIYQDLAPWNAYDPTSDNAMIFTTPASSMSNGYLADKCKLYEKIGFNWGE